MGVGGGGWGRNEPSEEVGGGMNQVKKLGLKDEEGWTKWRKAEGGAGGGACGEREKLGDSGPYFKCLLE